MAGEPVPVEISVQAPLQTTVNAYYTSEGDGEMVKSVVNGLETCYVSGYFEKEVDGWHHDHLPDVLPCGRDVEKKRKIWMAAAYQCLREYSI